MENDITKTHPPPKMIHTSSEVQLSTRFNLPDCRLSPITTSLSDKMEFIQHTVTNPVKQSPGVNSLPPPLTIRYDESYTLPEKSAQITQGFYFTKSSARQQITLTYM